MTDTGSNYNTLRLERFSGEQEHWAWWKKKTEAIFMRHDDIFDLISKVNILINSSPVAPAKESSASETPSSDMSSGASKEELKTKTPSGEETFNFKTLKASKANRILYSILISALSEQTNRFLVGIEPADGIGVWMALVNEYEKSNR